VYAPSDPPAYCDQPVTNILNILAPGYAPYNIQVPGQQGLTFYLEPAGATMGKAWAPANLTALTSAPPAVAMPLSGDGWNNGGCQQINYLSGDGHIHELSVPTLGAWAHADLTQITASPSASGVSLVAYVWEGGQSKQVVYLTGDGHIHELYVRTGGNWAHADLTQLAGAPPAAGTSLAAYGWESGDCKQVVYLTIDGHVHELSVTHGRGWAHADLTALTGAPPAFRSWLSSAQSPLAAYSWEIALSKQVVYLTADGHVHELYATLGGGWAHADLTAVTGAPSAGGLSLAAYSWEAGGSKQVVYLTTDGHVHELYVSVGGSWGHADLTASTGAPPVAGPSLAPYSWEPSLTAYGWEKGGSKQVAYLTADGHVHELRVGLGGSWGHADLTARTGAPPAAGPSLAAYSWEQGGSKQVVYVTGDGSLQELYVTAN
jgi:hypothetical protein